MHRFTIDATQNHNSLVVQDHGTEIILVQPSISGPGIYIDRVQLYKLRHIINTILESDT